MTNQTAPNLETGIERYKAGEGPETLIPYFKQMCDETPKNGNAWGCLAWLYMLDNQSEKAYKAAQKAVKLNPADPQIRINLAIAMLDAGQTGVRQHIEAVQHLLATDSELRQDVKETLAEGLTRKADWKGLQRVQQWLFG